MYLNTKLEQFNGDIRVAFIGCGKFISMFLSQYNQLKKIRIDSIIDLKIDQAKKNCLNSGLSQNQVEEINFTNSLDDTMNRDIDIFIEATGNPIVGTVHAKKIIENKKLGKIVSANILCWVYKHKKYFNEKWRVTEGGGPLGINLVHDIDMICYLLGPIQYVQAFTTNKTRKFKVEDTATVSLVFKSGALCTLNISDTIVAPWSYELTAGENPAYPITNQSAYMIGGTKGSLQFPNLKNWFYKKERSWWKKILVKEDINKKDDNTLINQINHFADVVSKKTQPKVNGNDGLVSLKIFAAIIKSAKLGKKVRL